LRDGIVIAQVALAVVLLAGSGLLVRSYLHLRATHPGFDPRGVLVAPVFLDPQGYNAREKVTTYYRTLFDRLDSIPGVTAVGGATTVPTSPLGPDFERPVWPEGTTPDRSQQTPASVRIVTPGYFAAMKLRVADGRAFDDREQPASPRVVMLSETLANRLWPGQRAIGRQLVVDYSTAGTYPYEVIGVVGDMRFRGANRWQRFSCRMRSIPIWSSTSSFARPGIPDPSSRRCARPCARSIRKSRPMGSTHWRTSWERRTRAIVRRWSRCCSSRQPPFFSRCSACTASSRSGCGNARVRSASAWPSARIVLGW
jgi:hypothetical protein